MCGFAGFLMMGHSKNGPISENIKIMTEKLRHRGPDDGGIWVDSERGIALGHRRLSILDLSPEGHQPMESHCGRYVIAFNGEIYNFQEIRTNLEKANAAPNWKGSSDTEILLAAISKWGLEDTLQQLNGMFAFALWDRSEKALYLARDRMGEKPLFYGQIGTCFLFGSELKALQAHPEFQTEIDRDALALFLRYSYIPSPFSIFRGIHKLLPAHSVRISSINNSQPIPKAYWEPRAVVERGLRDPFLGDDQEAVEELDKLLCDAVSLRMAADVPLGASLSGGIDSSTIVALMQAQSSRPVKTFSIGFHESGYNEAEYANRVAAHLGTDHTELYVTPQEALDVVPRLPFLYDEPFADPSQIPTFLVSELARQKVTVSLSGDGGDELFCGYNRYSWGRSVWNAIGWVPPSLRRIAAHGMTAFSPGAWESLLKPIGGILPGELKQGLVGDKIHKLAGIVGASSPEEMYRHLVSHWKAPSQVVIGGHEPETILTNRTQWAETGDFINHMMFLDMMSFLPDGVLAKVDRASMGVSLEVRVPLLDHRVVEFAWKLPLSMKIQNRVGKKVLREVLYRYVPRELMERPKMGFAVPIDSWLRGPLRDWAEELLSESRLDQEGFFNSKLIRKKWHEHLSGRRNWHTHLWNVLMFQMWWAMQNDKYNWR